MHRAALLCFAIIFMLLAQRESPNDSDLRAQPPAAKADASFTRQEDVIYGRKYGTALTLDVFTPKKGANGAAVVFAVSGGWFSDHNAINTFFFAEFLKRGYTVFAVVHRSNPRFTIPEAVEDMSRAVRFIRFHANDYHIDGKRIGIAGGSAGGHLSLMQGTTGNDGDPKAGDPVDRASSKVQAVACFFPPTDFLNYGETGKVALGRGTLEGFKAPFDFVELDKITRSFNLVLDEGKRREIGKQISPFYHADKNSAPTRIIHGDADKLVPIQQAEIIIAKLKEAGVPADLIVKPGAGHGWGGMEKDIPKLADWFDQYLHAPANHLGELRESLQSGVPPITRSAARRKVENQELQLELLQRMLADQHAFMGVLGLNQMEPEKRKELEPSAVKRLHETRRKNTDRMKEIVAEFGWSGSSLVGIDGATAAWFVVQNADQDRPFQKHCLDLLKEAVKNGEATGEQFARLTDHVRLGENKKQLYGTQVRTVAGKLQPLPIEDATNVDQRRQEIGLAPLADYLKFAQRVLK